MNSLFEISLRNENCTCYLFLEYFRAVDGFTREGGGAGKRTFFYNGKSGAKYNFFFCVKSGSNWCTVFGLRLFQKQLA